MEQFEENEIRLMTLPPEQEAELAALAALAALPDEEIDTVDRELAWPP